MSSPTLVYRELTFHFARAVQANQRPHTLNIVITPLATPTLAVPEQTFVEGPVAREVLLSATDTTVTYRLVPSDLAGLSERLLYRVAWRVGGVTGKTFTYDFAMPNVDLSFEQLHSLDYVLEGEVYLQQTDLGVRVAALDTQGRVVDADGVPVAMPDAIETLEDDLAAETAARIAADTALGNQLTGALTTQINAANAANLNAVNAARADAANALAAEVTTRAAHDTALTNALSAKADLVGGTVPLAQIPPAARMQGYPVADEAAMCALTGVQQFDVAFRPDGVFLLTGTNPADPAQWVKLNKVSTVNGQDGAVVLTLTQVAAAGGAVPQSQVTDLGAALAAKAPVSSVSAVSARVSAIEGDTTIVKTVGGVIPHTLNDTRMAYVDASGQFITRKDGTIISGAGGAVASVNAKLGHVVLNLTDVATAGGTVPQDQVAGLVGALGNKVDATDARLNNARTPLTHAASHTAAGSDPLTLSTAQVTGLAGTLSNHTNRIGSLETRVTTVESGGGGGGGTPIGALTWFSGTTLTGNFAADLTLHSPFGYNPDHPNANVYGYYYDPAGALSTEARFPYITPNGHLELRRWDESGAPDVVYATAADLSALTTTVNTKASASSVTALTTTVNTKASQAQLDALITTVNTKASQAQLDGLTTTVSAKADQSAVNLKANQSALDTTNATVSALTATVNTKATLTGGLLDLSTIPALPQSRITNLTSALAAKADLDGTGKLTATQIPTGIPQANITNLTSALAAKADLVGGKIPTDQLPALALTTTTAVSSRAAMLALTSVQQGDICVITTGVDQGSYILTATDPSVFANWTLLATPLAAVSSVNGKTGTAVLTLTDVASAGGAVPQNQVTGLATALAAKVDTTTYTTALNARPTWSTASPASPTTIEAILAAASPIKQQAAYVATSAVPALVDRQSIDGVLVPLGAIVLLTNQPSSVQHGLWQVNSGAWTRVADMATGSYLVQGTLVVVSSGSANAKTLWQVTSASGVVGTNGSTWAKIGTVADRYTPTEGDGIVITGTSPTQTLAVKAAPTVQVGTGSGADPYVAQPQGISVTSAGVAVDPAIVARKYVGTVPAGSATPRIYHNLNTRRVLVQVQEVATGTGVLVGWQASGANYVDLEFATAPSSGQWAVLVIG